MHYLKPFTFVLSVITNKNKIIKTSANLIRISFIWLFISLILIDVLPAVLRETFSYESIISSEISHLRSENESDNIYEFFQQIFIAITLIISVKIRINKKRDKALLIGFWFLILIEDIFKLHLRLNTKELTTNFVLNNIDNLILADGKIWLSLLPISATSGLLIYIAIKSRKYIKKSPILRANSYFAVNLIFFGIIIDTAGSFYEASSFIYQILAKIEESGEFLTICAALLFHLDAIMKKKINPKAIGHQSNSKRHDL